MAVRSVPVKQHLIKMVETNFPDFRFSGGWQGICGFVRERPGFWYDYLPIDRDFTGGRGVLMVNWALAGCGCNPGWYAWSTGDPWRRFVWGLQGGPDPEEPSSPLAQPGPAEQIQYQTGGTSHLPQALEVLADKLERYAIPALDKLAAQPVTSSELKRWQRLAERIVPYLELLLPEQREALGRWLKEDTRRKTTELPPCYFLEWLEEIKTIPGFAGEYETSPILRNWIQSWFVHALSLHP